MGGQGLPHRKPLEPPVQVGSKFGLNLIGPGAFNEVLGFIARLAQAGKPMALAVVINEAKIVQAIKALSPKTVVVFRRTDIPAGIENPSYAAGQQFFNQYWPALWGGQGADYFSFCNEWLVYADAGLLARQVQAYLGLMDAARNAGVKIVVGDLNVGFPHPTLNSLIEPMLARAESYGFPLNYHAYTRPGSTDPAVESAGRAMRWLDFVRTHPRLKVLIGEYGPDDGNASFPGAVAAVEMCRKYDVLLKPYSDQVLGYAYFAAVGATGSWQHSDVTPALGDIETWLRS